VVAESGAGSDEVEHLDDLGAEAAGELTRAAQSVLACDPPLFVGGGSEREIPGIQQAVVGDYAVAGGEYVREVGAHLAIDGNRVADAEFGSGRRG
jgi:hypothetical protein